MNAADPASNATLTVSIVIYRSQLQVLRATLASLLRAVCYAQRRGALDAVSIELLHNAEPQAALNALVADYAQEAGQQGVRVRMREGHGNIGYGRGHNLAILESVYDYHLVLNPDVVLSEDSLRQGLDFLAVNHEIVALSPAVNDEHGHKQYVCKRYPSVVDFVIRGFAPAAIRRLFAKRLAHYEMQDLPEHTASTDIPIISGCFMLFRSAALQAVGGFDERYFLYFEDFDLSLRVHKQGTLAYYPTMQIVHLGGNSAKKGLRHIGMFARSGLRFYNTHGWRLL